MSSVYEHAHIVLGQRADWRFGLYDLLVGELLLQVPPCQTPQMVDLIYGPLRQVVFIIIYQHTHTQNSKHLSVGTGGTAACSV